MSVYILLTGSVPRPANLSGMFSPFNPLRPLYEGGADKVALLSICLSRQHRLEKEQPQHDKNKKQFQDYQSPERPSPGHVPETVDIEPPHGLDFFGDVQYHTGNNFPVVRLQTTKIRIIVKFAFPEIKDCSGTFELNKNVRKQEVSRPAQTYGQ